MENKKRKRFEVPGRRPVFSVLAIAGSLGLLLGFALSPQGEFASHQALAAVKPSAPQAVPRRGPANTQVGKPANPFASPSEDDFFDEDEDSDFFGESAPPAGGGSNGNAAAPATDQAAGFSGPQSGGGGNSGVSVGGNQPLVNNTPQKFLKIDNETGEGSNEIVTDFNFPDADIMDIAKALGKLTGKSFILDKDVKGKITIVSNGPITVSDAWRAFLTALDINNYTLIPSGAFIRIARQRDARDKQLTTIIGKKPVPETDALITRVFSLRYINADEVARVFRSFIPPNARIVPYDQTNTVIVTDTGFNIAKLEKMLSILDVEGFDAGIEVIPVRFASASELSKLIDQLVPGTSSPTGPRFAGSAASRFAARKTKEGGIINTIIADERTNTLIVHANQKGANQVRGLVARLDKKQPSQVGGGKVHVIYLQYADAEQLSGTINGLSQASTAPTRPTTGQGGGTGVNPNQQVLFEGNIKVAPDKATNSLVVTASPSDFATIQRVVSRLDIPRDEVYVEVVIMEVSQERQFDFAVNIANPANGIASLPSGEDLLSFLSNPISQKGLVLGFKDGKQLSYGTGDNKITISSIQGLIKAIQTNTSANILATPQILTLDNQQATFQTREKIPVPKAVISSNGQAQTGVDTQDVLLEIKIKPQINKISNFVKLEVNTQLSDILARDLPNAVKDLAFATIERTANTNVVVGDGDTVVLGGLTRDAIKESVSKVPLLGDIPILGWLFKSKRNESKKVNMLIFITPHVIKQYEKTRLVLDKKLKERDDFIERNAGGNDPMRPYRDEIIRSLPDPIALKKTAGQTAQTIDTDPSSDTSAGSLGTPAPSTGGNSDSGSGTINNGFNNGGSNFAPGNPPPGYDPNIPPPDSFNNPYPTYPDPSFGAPGPDGQPGGGFSNPDFPQPGFGGDSVPSYDQPTF